MSGLSARLSNTLRQHVQEMGEQPWLFRREDHDWRWICWRDAADRIERLRPRIPTGRGVPYLCSAHPDAYLADLSIRFAGSRPLPLTGDHQEVELASRLDVPLDGRPAIPQRAAARGDEVEALEALLSPSRERDVLVVFSGPSDPLEGLLLDWILLRGGAAAFEADPAHCYATLLWARPTLLLGASALLAGLTAHLRDHRRARRGTLARARLLLDAGPEGISASDRELWRQGGVQVLDLSRFAGTSSAS